MDLFDSIFGFFEDIGHQTSTVLGSVCSVIFKPFALLFRLIGKLFRLLFNGFLIFICPAGIDRRVYVSLVRSALKNINYCLLHDKRELPYAIRYYIKKNNSYRRFRFRYLVYWLLPACSLIAVIVGVLLVSQKTIALSVSVNGEEIGYVLNEADFIHAASDAEEILSFGKDNSKFDIDVSYKFAYVDYDDISSSSEIMNSIIRRTTSDTCFACGVFVDGKLFGIAENASFAKTAFDEALAEMSYGKDFDLVCFVQDIRYSEGIYPSELVMSNSEFSALIEGASDATDYYTVKEGDSIESVSSSSGISVSELLKLNSGIDEESELTIGQKLITGIKSGSLNLKILRTVVSNIDIEYESVEVPSNVLYIGSTRKLSNGENGVAQVTRLVTYVNDLAVSSAEVSRLTVKESVPERVMVGTRALDASYSSLSLGGVFIWPIIGAYGVNSDYGYRWGKLHAGIDLGMGGAEGTSLGKTVVAAASGTVTTSTVHSSYGYYIIIDHGNGISTVYGHCLANSLMVSAGDYVSAGQPIALVGSTGYSTGPHLHFEVRVNGTKVDPKPYLGIS